MKAKIVRTTKNSEGVLGLLYFNENFICFTLEPPDYNNDGIADNEKNRSCIPVGDYHCVRVVSPDFGDTFYILGVPKRDKLAFHWGNTSKNTHGCILLGQFFRGMTLYKSKDAMKEFLNKARGFDSFDLRIEEG